MAPVLICRSTDCMASEACCRVRPLAMMSRDPGVPRGGKLPRSCRTPRPPQPTTAGAWPPWPQPCACVCTVRFSWRIKHGGDMAASCTCHARTERARCDSPVLCNPRKDGCRDAMKLAMKLVRVSGQQGPCVGGDVPHPVAAPASTAEQCVDCLVSSISSTGPAYRGRDGCATDAKARIFEAQQAGMHHGGAGSRLVGDHFQVVPFDLLRCQHLLQLHLHNLPQPHLLFLAVCRRSE